MMASGLQISSRTSAEAALARKAAPCPRSMGSAPQHVQGTLADGGASFEERAFAIPVGQSRKHGSQAPRHAGQARGSLLAGQGQHGDLVLGCGKRASQCSRTDCGFALRDGGNLVTDYEDVGHVTSWLESYTCSRRRATLLRRKR
jgi:hypothetical protein